MSIFSPAWLIMALLFQPMVQTDELSEYNDRVRTLAKNSSSLTEIKEAVDIRQKLEDQLLANSEEPTLHISIAGEPHLAELLALRLGSSAYWAFPTENQKTYAREVLERSNRIATKAWTSSLANDRESRALRSSAAGLRAVAMLGLLRLEHSDRWTEATNLDDINQLLEESLQLARGLRGVILQAAAITAAAQGDIDEAKNLLKQARSEPLGLDPLVLLLLEKSFAAGGVNAHQRVKAAESLFSTDLSLADRLFLMKWRARSGFESGESRDSTVQAIRSHLDDMSAKDRRVLLRPVSEIVMSIPGESSDDFLEIFGRARSSTQSGAPEISAQLFRSVGENAPQSYIRAEGWLELAQLELKAEDREGALECLINAITSDPAHPSSEKAAQLAIRISRQLGSEVPTTQALAQILTNHPDRNAWRIVIAEDSYDQDRLEEAMTTWREIPTLAPESIKARVRIIETILSGGKRWNTSDNDVFKAIDLLDESLDMHPDESERIRSQSLRIKALLAANRLREAARAAEELPPLKDMDSDVRIFAVTAAIAAFSQADRKEDAARMLNEFGKVDPKGRTQFANTYLKDVAATLREYLRTGDTEKAITNAKAVYANGVIPPLAQLQNTIAENPWPALYAAFILRLAEQNNDAIAYSEEILKQHPGSSEALLEKAEALYAQGGPTQWQEAFRIFKLIRVSSQRGSRMWWQSELRQLEILEKASSIFFLDKELNILFLSKEKILFSINSVCFHK